MAAQSSMPTTQNDQVETESTFRKRISSVKTISVKLAYLRGEKEVVLETDKVWALQQIDKIDDRIWFDYEEGRREATDEEEESLRKIENYLKLFPADKPGKHTYVAEIIRERVAERVIGPGDSEAWIEAMSTLETDSLRLLAFQQYRRNYPEGYYLTTCQDSIEAIQNRLNFRKHLSADSIKSLADFVKNNQIDSNSAKFKRLDEHALDLVIEDKESAENYLAYMPPLGGKHSATVSQFRKRGQVWWVYGLLVLIISAIAFGIRFFVQYLNQKKVKRPIATPPKAKRRVITTDAVPSKPPQPTTNKVVVPSVKQKETPPTIIKRAEPLPEVKLPPIPASKSPVIVEEVKPVVAKEDKMSVALKALWQKAQSADQLEVYLQFLAASEEKYRAESTLEDQLNHFQQEAKNAVHAIVKQLMDREASEELVQLLDKYPEVFFATQIKAYQASQKVSIRYASFPHFQGFFDRFMVTEEQKSNSLFLLKLKSDEAATFEFLPNLSIDILLSENAQLLQKACDFTSGYHNRKLKDYNQIPGELVFTSRKWMIKNKAKVTLNYE